MNRPRGTVLLILLAFAVAGSWTEATADTGWEAGLGVGYLAPRSNELSSLYDGGPSFHLMLARRFARPAGSIGLEIGYFQSSAELTPPFFVSRAEAELLWMPIDLIARLELARSSRLVPILGLGLQILYARERFEYRLGEETRSQDPKERWDPGFLLVAGIDRPLPPRLRLEGFMSLVAAERRLSVGSEDRAVTGDDGFDAGAFGLRLAWRFP